VPALAAPGMPVSVRLVVLKAARHGLFWMRKVGFAPPRIVHRRRKGIGRAHVCRLAGVPEIVRVLAATTLIVKASSELVWVPSLTLITMFE